MNKEVRQLSKALFRSSFTDGQLDEGRISALVGSLLAKKPRNYLAVLDNYRRLLRLEIEKRTATIESASELNDDIRQKIVADLRARYGNEVTTKFAVNPELLGGMRVRVGDDVWDSSVRSRLQRLEHQF